MSRYRRYVGRWQTLAGFCDGDDANAVIRLTMEQAALNSRGAWWHVTDTHTLGMLAQRVNLAEMAESRRIP